MTYQNVGNVVCLSVLMMLTACSAEVLDPEGEASPEAPGSAEQAIEPIDVPPPLPVNCTPAETISVKYAGGISTSEGELPYGTLLCPSHLVQVRTHWDTNYVTAAQAAAVDVGFVAEGTDRPNDNELEKCVNYRESVAVSRKSFLASEYTRIGGGSRRGVLDSYLLPSGIIGLRCVLQESASFVPIPTVPGCAGPLCTNYRVSIRAYNAETGAKYPVVVKAARAEYLDLD